MSIIRRVLGGEQTRALNAIGLNPAAFDRAPVFSTSRVDERSTLSLTTAWSSITLLADLISTLPIDAYVRDNGNRRPYRPNGSSPMWLATPTPDEPQVGIQSILSDVVVSLYLNGNAFIYAPKDPQTAEPLEVRVLDPRKVQIVRDGRSVSYVVRTGTELNGVSFGADTILHIPLIRMPGEDRGINPIESMRRTLGLGITLEDSASNFFGNASTPSGVIETPNVLTEDQMNRLKVGWEQHHTREKAHAVGILQGGASFKALSFRPEDAQLLASREFTVNEIARMFRVPPALLAVTTPGAMSFASVAELNQAFVSYTLRPLAEKIERALSTLIPLPEAFVRMSMDALVRGNLRDRFEAHRIAVQEGWESIADVRALEDLPPIQTAAAGAYRQPLNSADSALASARQSADIYAALIGAGMDPVEAKRIAGL